MTSIELDAQTASTIRFAAETAGISPGEVVRRLLERSLPPVQASPSTDATAGVPIHAVYEGRRTSGHYDLDTRSVTIDDGPLAGRRYKSPSGAAIAVVSHYRPGVNPSRNGWSFWTVTDSGRSLSSVRTP